MFSRKRSKSNPPRNQARNHAPPPSSAALAGASLAFVKNSTSNSGLSSAAAAAALRSHTSSPTPVGDIQTKRMIRRGSNSSLASAPGGMGRGGLQRQNSSGSLTERSFRGTSPSRPSTASGALPTYNPPPVPAIPRELAAQSRQRASSVEPPPRLSSPVSHGRGMSVDRGQHGAAPRSPTVAQRPKLDKIVEREDSRRSINFSYPRSPSPSSSPSPISQKAQSGWHSGPVTPDNRSNRVKSDLPPLGPSSNQRMQAELSSVAQFVRNVASQPVVKKQPTTSNVEGMRLANGNVAGKPSGTAVQAQSQAPSANTGRKLESIASSSNQDTRALPVDPNIPVSDAVAQADSQRSKTISETPKHPKLGEVMQRTASVSPARSAHFAETSLELPGGMKHKPPPRSLSPAKSALKHSPSSSIRNASPITRFSSAISEASDYGSDDGARSSAKKKKSVRVSFDESVAGENVPPSPTVVHKVPNPNRWSVQSQEDDLDEIMKPRPALPSFGSLRGRRTDDADVPEKVTETVSSSLSNSQISEPLEASKDHAIGSIVAQDFAKKGDTTFTDPVPPQVTSLEGSGYNSETDESVDGNTIARPPTPPHNSNAKMDATNTEAARPSTGDSLSTPGVSIAVQPPTPNLEEEHDPLQQVPGSWRNSGEVQPMSKPLETGVTQASTSATVTQAEEIQTITPIAREVRMPVSEEDEDHLDTVLEESSSDGDSVYSDAEEDLSELGGFASLNAIVEKDVKTPPRSSLRVNTSSITPTASQQSPVAPASPKTYVPESPHAITTSVAISTPESSKDENWDQAKQYWSGLSADKRREVEREEAMKFANVPDSSPIASENKPKKKKKDMPAQTVPAAAPVTTTGRRQQQPAQPPKPALKKTMRAEPEPLITPRQTSMRRSMRDGPPPIQTQQNSQPALRQSMRGDRPETTMRTSMRPGGLAASRFSPTEETPPRGALQKRIIPATTVATAPAAAVPRPRSTVGMAASRHAPPAKASKSNRAVMSDADDSDGSASSFRRSRPRNREGGFAMRTMRGPQQAASPAPSAPPPRASRTTMRPSSPDLPKSSRFSIRSLSPTGSFMRKSFRRDSVDEPERPTSKGSMFSFSKDKRPKSMVSVAPAPVPRASPRAAPKSKPAPAPARQFKSRFGDSSDEDEPRPSQFQSRFADSDDDEEDVPPIPKDLTPVRGIPRRPGDEDANSTDLEDEDSELERDAGRRAGYKPAIPSTADIEKASAPTKTAEAIQGSALASGSLRQSKHAKIADDVPEPSSTLTPTREKKRGFFSFGRKKNGAAPTVARPQTPPTREATVSPAPQSPSSPTGRSPKLQRRNTPQRMASDSWPLPAPPKNPAIDDSLRPMSSDGIALRAGTLRNGNIPTRPRLEKRFSSGNTAITAPVYSGDPRMTSQANVVLGRNGKKKKFPKLRSVFGLKD